LSEEFVEQRRKKWMDQSDEGTYTIISDMCQDCFLETITRLSGEGFEDLPVHTWDGRKTTVKDLV